MNFLKRLTPARTTILVLEGLGPLPPALSGGALSGEEFTGEDLVGDAGDCGGAAVAADVVPGFGSAEVEGVVEDEDDDDGGGGGCGEGETEQAGSKKRFFKKGEDENNVGCRL